MFTPRAAWVLILLSASLSINAQITASSRGTAQVGHPPSGKQFAQAVSYDSGGGDAYAVAVADVNGDGKPDLVVANACATNGCKVGNDSVIGVLLGNGDGTFQAPVTYDSGGEPSYDSLGPQAIAVQDVNGDGKPDVLLATGFQGVAVLLGNGDGTFKPAVVYSSGGPQATSISVGDMNGDGKPDLVVLNYCLEIFTSSCGSGGVTVLLGNGDGTFQPAMPGSASGGDHPLSAAVGDVNCDGMLDVVVTNSDVESVGVLLGNGDGTFRPVETYETDYLAGNGIALADVNGDGFLDIVTSTVLVFLGKGDGTFQDGTEINGGDYPTAVAAKDVNGDGKPDLLVANRCSDYNCPNASVDVLDGKGDGNFRHPVAYNSGAASQSIAVADVNGDGTPDLVVADDTYPDGSVGVLLNESNAVSTSTTLSSTPNPSEYGQNVVFTATVTSSKGPPPDGETVTFKLKNVVSTLGTGTLNGGVATFSDSSLQQSKRGGDPEVYAVYGGDADFAGSQSAVLEQVVNPDPTTTTLTSSQNPSIFGQSVTFTATIGGNSSRGSVSFENGGVVFGDVDFGGDPVQYTTTKLPVGSNSITAVYSPDDPLHTEGSVSAPVIQVVNQSPTTTTITSAPNPSAFGKPVTFTAEVAAEFGGVVHGSVTFIDGTTALGTVNLSGGKARFETSGLSVGSHTISADYNGDADFATSSAQLIQVVNQ
jgi:hypothetical protein